MNNFPFTLEEATDIAEDFEDLIDTDFAMGNSLVYEVNNVLVCPYEEEDKKKFATYYHDTKEAQLAMKSYIGNEYDVIVFAYNIDDITNYLYTDIRRFTEQRGITYSFPGEE